MKEYLCDVKDAGGNLAKLCNIRDNWFKYGIINYYVSLTKEEIKKELENDNFVYVKGFGEIGIEDIDKLN